MAECKNTPHCQSRREHGDGECGCYHDSMGMALAGFVSPRDQAPPPDVAKMVAEAYEHLHHPDQLYDSASLARHVLTLARMLAERDAELSADRWPHHIANYNAKKDECDGYRRQLIDINTAICGYSTREMDTVQMVRRVREQCDAARAEAEELREWKQKLTQMVDEKSNAKVALMQDVAELRARLAAVERERDAEIERLRAEVQRLKDDNYTLNIAAYWSKP
jgi:hypothetical protein